MTNTKMTNETLTEKQMSYLGMMARCFKAKTMKELADQYNLYDGVIWEDEIEEHNAACIWLRDLQERPDADALLAEAIKISASAVEDEW